MKNVVLKEESYIAPGPVSRGGILDHLTGSWRYLRPRYEEKLAPCSAACPAGEHVEAWIRLLEEERYVEAWQLIKAVNPFPRVCGRVCFHPCETQCNRGQFDRPIAIHALERFVADHAISLTAVQPPKMTESGKSVGIIGSGPAGLTCAYHLALRGHSVTIYEAEDELGGLLRYGIPAFRLPKNVLDEEIRDIVELGVEVHTGMRIESLEELRRVHDALFVATGLGASNKLGISGEQGDGVVDAIEFLRLVNSGRAPALGGKVLVVGGGSAAIDAARAALRLGAAPTIIYRRSRAEMPAHLPEVEEAEREGVAIHYLAQPVRIIRENGNVILVECVMNQLGEPDNTSRRQPVSIPRSNFLAEADAVIVAVGARPDGTLLDPDLFLREGPDESEKPPPAGLPEDVFAGGDLTSPERTVAHAIGSGRRTAMMIDKYLGGSGEDPASYLDGEIAGFESLNLDYFSYKQRIRLPMLPLREREGNFSEIYLDLSASVAAQEAERCFHCGVCISCDNCCVFCPDIAIRRSEDGTYSIDYDYCKGCGICVHECPRSAMSIDEEIRR